MEHDGGRQDRDRNGGQRDGRGAPVQQEGEQHDGDDGHGLEQHLGDVVDRGLDEVGLAEQDVVGLDAVAAASRVSSASALLDLARQADRVDVGLLLDGDDDGGRAHVAGVAALGAGGEAHLGHLAQVNGPVARFGDDEIAQVVEA